MYCNVLMLGINRRAQRAQLGVRHTIISGGTLGKYLSINLILHREATWPAFQGPDQPARSRWSADHAPSGQNLLTWSW